VLQVTALGVAARVGSSSTRLPYLARAARSPASICAAASQSAPRTLQRFGALRVPYWLRQRIDFEHFSREAIREIDREPGGIYRPCMSPAIKAQSHRLGVGPDVCPTAGSETRSRRRRPSAGGCERDDIAVRSLRRQAART
jgi:hypothetical protein